MIQLDEDVDFINAVSTIKDNQLYSPKDSPHGSAEKVVVNHYLKNQVGGLARRMIQLEEDIDAINSMSDKKDNQYSPQHHPDTNNSEDDELLNSLNAFITTSNESDENISTLLSMLNDMKIMYGVQNSSTSNDEALLSTLTGEQRLAIEMICRGENVYIHGNPGTGKSYLLLQLKLILSDKNVVFLSPTGISAENIGGITIHSYFNIDINEPYTFKQTDIPRPDVIVIDEVSMLSGELFDIISHKAMKLWNSTQAMGGCQVVLVGDFHQLPPIVDKGEKAEKKNKRQRGSCPIIKASEIGNRGYCFQAKTWRDLSLRNVNLTEAKRQTDPFFYSVLNKIRTGDQLNDGELEYIQKCKTKQRKKLFVRKESVRIYNTKEYSKRKNTEKEVKYFSAIQQQPGGIIFERKETIKLKIGVEVFLNVNLRLYSPPYLVNGSRGTVRAFISAEVVIQQLEAERTLISENNTLYDYITCLIEVLTKANVDRLTEFYPVIEFKDQENKPFRRCILPFRKNDYNKTEIIMPLTYAWGLTIYKSQGLSFDSLSVDLKSCRELSTAYVALSRCKDASKLHIENESVQVLKNMKKKGPDPIVKTFYETGESELWTNDNSNNIDFDDYFSEKMNFKCLCCQGSSTACYDYANPSIRKLLKELIQDEYTESEMNKILLALAEQGYNTMERLLKRELTVEKLKSWFEKEGGIRDRVIEDAVEAIQLMFRERR